MRSVGVAAFPLVAELGDRLLLAVRDEDRVEAEPARSTRLVGNQPCQDPGAAELLATRREGDELADVPRAPALPSDALQLPQQPLDVLAASEPRRVDSWRAAQTVDLEARVLAQGPGRRIDGAPELGLRSGVLVVGRSCFGRVVVRL